MAKVKNYGEIDIIALSIEQVEPNDYNPNAMSQDRFEAFCSFIDEVGFLSPIAVTKKGASSRGKYTIIDGEHRYKYLLRRGAKKIPVVILSSKFDGATAESMLASLRFNLHGDNDSLRLGGVYTAIVADGYSYDSIAAHIGDNAANVSDIINMLNSPKQVTSDVGGVSDIVAGSSAREGDEVMGDEFTEITFSLPLSAWRNVVQPELSRLKKRVGVSTHPTDETIELGQLLEYMAVISSQVPESEF